MKDEKPAENPNVCSLLVPKLGGYAITRSGALSFWMESPYRIKARG